MSYQNPYSPSVAHHSSLPPPATSEHNNSFPLENSTFPVMQSETNLRMPTEMSTCNNPFKTFDNMLLQLDTP